MSPVNGLGSITPPVSNSAQTTNINKSVDEAESFKKALEKAKNSNDDEALKKVCQEFESIFVNMMFKTMNEASGFDEGEDALIEKSYGRGIFEDMKDEELAKKIAKGGGIGIGDMMYKQLKKYTAANEEPETPTLDVKK